MSDITADIMETARNVSVEVFDAYVEAGDADTIIARAILAERERCAAIRGGEKITLPAAPVNYDLGFGDN